MIVEKAFCEEEMADTTAKKDAPSGGSRKLVWCQHNSFVVVVSFQETVIVA